MDKKAFFTNAICTYKEDNSAVFSRTVLVLKIDRQTTYTINIVDVPWEQVWQFADMVYSMTKPIMEAAIQYFIENFDETKNRLKLLSHVMEIKNPKELFRDKKKMWPFFVRDLTDKDFHDLMHDAEPITESTNILSRTNNLMEKAIERSQYLHTVRVLYRIQTDQLKILRKYNSPKNNIYFIDFETGNEKSTHKGIESNLEFLSNEESRKDKENLSYVKIAPRSYSKNEDITYTRRLSDLLLSLSYLKPLDKASFWAIPGIPTIRATLVGDKEDTDFTRSYFVAVREFEPGLSGRVSVNREFNNRVYEELQKINKPRQVNIINETKMLKEKLYEQIKFTEEKYDVSFSKHKKFVDVIDELNTKEIDNFNRRDLEAEANVIFERISK